MPVAMLPVRPMRSIVSSASAEGRKELRRAVGRGSSGFGMPGHDIGRMRSEDDSTERTDLEVQRI